MVKSRNHSTSKLKQQKFVIACDKKKDPTESRDVELSQLCTEMQTQSYLDWITV